MGMKILIFNWRDIKSPYAGGSEVFTHEISRRLVKWGNEVTLFTSEFPDCKKKEIVDGVEVIRSGNRYKVYLEARRYYKKWFKGKFDVVVDEINTIPFFTPLYVKEPIVVVIHQLCREIWFYETKFPVNVSGYVIEPLYLRLYKKIPAITVSESTMQDLLNYGFEDVRIVRDAINCKPLDSIPEKEKNPTLIFVGRLKNSKRVHHIIKAFSLVKKQKTNARLWIVGDGDRDYKQKLRKLVKENKLEDSVTFFGFVDERKKYELMKRAHAIVLTSVREGWGIIVIEANAMGTPAIAYDVHGLRDSVKHGYNGLLVKDGDVEALVNAIINLLEDDKLRDELSRNAIKWAEQFSWDESAKKFERMLELDQKSSLR